MKVLGASRRARVSGVDQLPGKGNYLLGADQKNWQRNVNTYGRVKYEAIYPGIDLLYYGNQRQLEYAFIVSPGANPNRINVGFRSLSGKSHGLLKENK